MATKAQPFLGSFGQGLYNAAKSILPAGLWQGNPIASIGNYVVPKAYAAGPAPTPPNNSGVPGLTSTSNLSGLNFNVAPSTGGQAPGGGGSAPSGGGQPANSATLIQPPSNNPGVPQQDQIDILKGQYGQAASDLQAQEPLLDQSYATSQGDINNTIQDTQKTADAQKATNDITYGNLLRQNAQTFNQAKTANSATYGALGSLDSSSHDDAQLKLDQSASEQAGRTQVANTTQDNSIDQQANTFINTAKGKLGDLAVAYQQGKNAISSALANNNLNEANAISTALASIRQQAFQIQTNISNFANQAAYLKSLGYGVQTGVSATNPQQFVSDTNTFYNNLINSQKGGGLNLSSTPSPLASAQGYIGSGNKAQIDPLTGLPIAGAVDPTTGLPVATA